MSAKIILRSIKIIGYICASLFLWSRPTVNSPHFLVNYFLLMSVLFSLRKMKVEIMNAERITNKTIEKVEMAV